MLKLIKANSILRLAFLLCLVLLVFSLAQARADDKNVRLIEAAAAGQTDRIQQLLTSGADPGAKDQFGNTALMHACWYGRTGAVKLLLEAKADVNAKNNREVTALMWSSRQRS